MSKHSIRAGSAARPSISRSASARACCAAWLVSSAGQRQFGVAARQVEVAGAFAAHVALDLHLALAGARQRLLDQFAIGDVAVEHDLARRRLLGVVLRDERGQHFLRRCRCRWSWGRRRACRGCGRRGTPAAARRPPRPAWRTASTSRSAARPSTYWRACRLRIDGDQVAQARGFLEIQARAGRFHRLDQFVAELVAAPVQEQAGAAHAFGIVARRHQPHARRAAAADLVLQARPRAVAEHAVLAAAQLEQLVHQVERFAHRADAGVRAEVAARDRARPAVQGDARPGLLGQQHVRIALVVAQQHVVARLERLDQLVFEQQRFGLGARDRDFHARDLRQHRHDARGLSASR